MSNRLTVDMHIECIDTTDSIDHVIICTLAMLQWVKVSLATLLSTFYCYFAPDDQKCINSCMHCWKLKCIHYSSNFRFFTFYYKHDSFCATCTTYNPCVFVDVPLPYSLITNKTTQYRTFVIYLTSFSRDSRQEIVWFYLLLRNMEEAHQQIHMDCMLYRLHRRSRVCSKT